MKTINTSPKDSNWIRVIINGKREKVYLLPPGERGWMRIFKADDMYIGIPTMDAPELWEFIRSVYV